jgi:N-dimethylarginine dimethylaminohydrolase
MTMTELRHGVRSSLLVTDAGAILEAAGAEVHAIPLREVGMNGSGVVACLTRPILRG